MPKTSETTGTPALALVEQSSTGTPPGGRGVATQQTAEAARQWLLRQDSPASADRSLQHSLTSALGVGLTPLVKSIFPASGGWIDVVVGCDITLADGADVGRAIQRVEAAMTPATSDECEDWLAMMQAACARRADSEETATVALDLYSAALRQYPADVAKAVCIQFATRRGTNWFPALGELLEVADRMAKPRQAMLAALRSPPPAPPIPKQREPKDVRDKALADLMAGYKVMTFEDKLAAAAAGGLKEKSTTTP